MKEAIAQDIRAHRGAIEAEEGMTPEEKLARVEELLRERDAITAELLELMGAQSTEDDEEAEEEEGPTPTRSSRKCSVCQKPGHSSRTCPKNKPESYGFKGGKPERKAPTFAAKPCCGSQGPRHKADCPEDAPTMQRFTRRSGYPMSKDNFERVKLAVTHDIPANAIARNLGLTTTQVNEAILAKDYDEYARPEAEG